MRGLAHCRDRLDSNYLGAGGHEQAGDLASSSGKIGES